ncbi:HAMP domain-containing sensor histidine kinase [Actinomadura sp. 7K534]|uniref:sensor histidine kinase n=1 Tax=Actinomadura sp. 7K534 TaxID=2530366 RepID=UPI00104D87CE|nr:HAMP domain-containing sensor histidine kinase [Actinomadura sp. 7K534]TDB98652.1 HAMP domain-containing histidine kinase [Actinomadura sp. 7K534]
MAAVSASVTMLFLSLLSRHRALAGRERVHNAIDNTFFLLRRGALPEALPTLPGHEMQVLDARGRVISATPALRGRPRIAAFAPERGHINAQRTVPLPASVGGHMKILAVRIEPKAHRHHYGRGSMLAYIASPEIPWYASRRSALAATAAAALATAGAFAVAYRSTARALSPVEQVRAEFAEITATDVSRRVPVPDHQEFRAMVQTLNSTQDSLEATVTDLRQFTSAASHDMRSPLAGIRLLLEEALLYPDEVDWPQVAHDTLAAVDRQHAILTDLVELSRLDSGEPLHMQSTDLTDLTDAELRHRPSGRIPITSDLREHLTVECDRDLICRVLANLLDNADRHAATWIKVRVGRSTQGTAAELEVSDDGDGIPPDQREKVFERFVRLKSSRERDPNGTGLGLPISRHIGRLHNGTLTVEPSHPPGARLLMRLPLSQPQ